MCINKINYPGIGIAHSASLNIQGDFFYGADCGVGIGANLIIPKHASLTLADACYIGRYVELGPSSLIRIGSYTSIQDRCIFLGDVTIGRYCSIAPNVYISSGKHYFDLEPSALIKDQDLLVLHDENLKDSHSKPVVVEDDCWLGINVVVMAGVTIGKGAVIGANSVVTKDVKPYTVVAGVPAKILKERLHFSPPKRIAYNNESDLPYFYSGFEVSKASLVKNAIYKGYKAQSELVLALNSTLGNSIHIIVKNLGSPVCTLVYGNQHKEIIDSFQEVVFIISEYSKKTNRFNFQANISNASLVVEKAWIE